MKSAYSNINAIDRGLIKQALREFRDNPEHNHHRHTTQWINDIIEAIDVANKEAAIT